MKHMLPAGVSLFPASAPSLSLDYPVVAVRILRVKIEGCAALGESKSTTTPRNLLAFPLKTRYSVTDTDFEGMGCESPPSTGLSSHSLG